MKITEESSINTLLIKRQSQSNGILSGGFSSLLNQDNQESNKDSKQSTSEHLQNQQQILQNQAYLNKISLGIAV
ncbi:MAG: hypothetical protein U9R39_03675 [Campylobacterota bacterium]|nr:hypothetical protein [Campylobacterota bacterium]